jgi:hypothetical protein
LTGGAVEAVNPVIGTVIDNSAFAAVGGNIVTIRGIRNADNPGIGIPTLNSSNITLTGGTASATNQGTAKADASALILAAKSADISIGGDFTIAGGDATATGAKAAATAIAGTEIGAQISGEEYLKVFAKNMFITSGTGDSVSGGSAQGNASLATSGAIRIIVTGQGAGQGLVLDGASGSGLFDSFASTLIPVNGVSYPITVIGRIEVRGSTVPGSQEAFVIAGAPLVDDSLLAAFLRATESSRQDALGQDPGTQGDSKGQAGVCR